MSSVIHFFSSQNFFSSDFYYHDGYQNTPLGPLITMRYQKKSSCFRIYFGVEGRPQNGPKGFD